MSIKITTHPLTHPIGVYAQYFGSAKSLTSQKVFFAPFAIANDPIWCYFDCATKRYVSWEHGITAVHGAFNGIAWDPIHDRMYLAPFAQGPETNWFYITCADNVLHTLTHGEGVNAFAYRGIQYDPDNHRMVLIPSGQATSNLRHYINCDTNTVVEFTSSCTAVESAYAGGKYVPALKRVVYAPLDQASEVNWHYLDCETYDEVAYLHGTDAVYQAYTDGDIDTENNRLFFNPMAQLLQDHLHYLDLNDFTFHSFTNDFTFTGNPYGGIGYVPDHKIMFLAPYSQSNKTTLHYIDCSIPKLVEYPNTKISQVWAYWGVTVDEDGSTVYAAPHDLGEYDIWHYFTIAVNTPGRTKPKFGVEFSLQAISENYYDSMHFIDLGKITDGNLDGFWNLINDNGSNIEITDSENNVRKIYICSNTFSKANKRGTIIAQLDNGTSEKTYRLNVDNSISSVSDRTVLLDDNCIASHGFDDISGSVLTNRCGSHNGVIYGNPTLGGVGMFGLEIILNGTSQYLETDTFTELVDNNGNNSLILVAKQNILDVEACLFDMRDSSCSFYAITNASGNMYIVVEHGNTSGHVRFDYSALITAGQQFVYSHIYDGNQALEADKLKVYIDKTSPSTTNYGTLGEIYTTENNKITLGKLQSSSEYFLNGGFDEFLFFNVTKTKSYLDYIADELNGVGITWGQVKVYNKKSSNELGSGRFVRGRFR